MEKEKNSFLTKFYARHPWAGVDSSSWVNPGLSPCLLRDLSPCTAKHVLIIFKLKYTQIHSCSKIFSLSQLPKTEHIQDISLNVTVSIIWDSILNYLSARKKLHFI